jgi:L-fuculose-phosphate aldolase
MDPFETQLRQEMIEITNRLSTRGLIRAAGGNISVRLNDEEILITPTRLAKGFLREEDIVVVDYKGHLVRGDRPPSMDTAFHIAAYEVRPDAEAVIHAHPLITTAFTVAGKEIPSGILPEFEIFFPRGVPTVPYETPATRDLAETCQPYLKEHDLIVLAHHGTLSLGHSLTMAWLATEHLETCMEVLFYAECLGGAHPLPEDKVNLLREIHRQERAHPA